jgi:hypothetical protein
MVLKDFQQITLLVPLVVKPLVLTLQLELVL